MRSFEFVEGTSAKFWEIWRDGSEVTVRFGRVGTAGQTKVKTFEEPGLAQVHEDKLIAEKTRKGYAEITAPTAAAAAHASAPAPASAAPAPAAAPPAPISGPASPAPVSSTPDVSPAPASAPTSSSVDEDAFVFPAAWNRHRYARRGSTGPVSFTPDPKAREKSDKEVKRTPNQVTKILESAGTDRSLRAPALAWRAGDPAAPPVGAAAVLVAAALGVWYNGHEMAVFADTWVAERGVLFAAEAAVHMMGLHTTEDGTRGQRGSNYCVTTMGPADSRYSHMIDHFALVLFRVRQALAAASDADYAAAVTMLAGHRDGSRYQRVATSVLAPGRADWVEHDIAEVIAAQDGYLSAVLLAAAGTGEQATALAKSANAYTVVGSMPLLATVADGVGPACAPAMFTWFDEDTSADAQRRVLSMLTPLPGDEVMAGLIERIDAKYVVPALLEAAERFPARALRLLAGAAGASRTAADLLRGHVAGHPDLVDRVLPSLSAEAAARVTGLVGDAAAVVVAAPEAVPPLLAAPPWLHLVRAAKPVVIAGLACDDEPAMGWLPGEREAWRQTPYTRVADLKLSWEQLARRVRTNQHHGNQPALFFLEAPEELARDVLRAWKPRNVWEVEAWMRVVVARFETDALDACLSLATDSSSLPAETVPLLMPFASPRVAVLMADWLARLKSVRREALAWLLRHPAATARALVPAALQKPGTARRQAEQALLALHGNGHGDAVRAAAGSYGPEAAAAIDTLLAVDPLQVLPAKIPPNPAWAVPGLLPPLSLRGGAGALPAEVVAHVVTVLALSRADDPYPGVEIVKEACDPGSLAEFGWQLFQRWQGSGASSKENWALDMLALIGDDDTVRRLTPLILAWPGEGGHAKAVTGVHVLAAIGTDVALMHLHGIAQRAKFKGLKSAAQQKIEEVAAGLGLSADQLADRLVPDFGLEPDGSLRLDYGPRQFVVGFDEQLRPYVTDAGGKHLKALPKPGTRDDDKLAPAAFQRFGGLKKDVRTIATDQIRRLEQAMVAGRRWTGAELRELFVGHPLLWHIARRLVWGLYDASGAPVAAIRVAEDRSFSTVDDDETTITDDTLVGVAHPLHLGDALPGWAEVFADYEILQPFPQLSRATFTLTPEELAASSLARFEKLTLPTTKLLGLERRGWRRDEPLDGGVQAHIVKVVGPGLEMAVGLDPGIVVGMVTEFPEQTLTSVFLHDGSSSGWSRDDSGRVSLGRLDPVTASEIIRDLTEISA